MEYKWTINKVKVSEDNLVVRVELTVTGTDGDNSASVAYSRDLVRGDSFTPFDQLTEQQVLDWCFKPQLITFKNDFENTISTIEKHLKAEGEAQVMGQIERQLAQKESEPALPWATM